MEDLRDEPVEWPVVRSTDLHRGDWVVALRADTVTAPGRPDEDVRPPVVEHPGAVMVLAVDDDERVLCCGSTGTRRRRGSSSSRPGCSTYAGEDPVDAAKRELREEAALEADGLAAPGRRLPSPGISDECTTIYLARGLTDADRGDFEPEHEEAEMERRWVPFADLLDAVLDGRVATLRWSGGARLRRAHRRGGP